MFYRACESSAAVDNIENGQPNRSAMERPHSGGNAYILSRRPLHQVRMFAYGGYHRHWLSLCKQNRHRKSDLL